MYTHPQERVLFNEKRDANPVFHLMEAIWMLAGEDSVDFLVPFNQRMREYAEDDGRIHGAYGHRWRMHFGHDQLAVIADVLRRDPKSRQAVLGMWSPDMDLAVNKRDRPCNTHVYFEIQRGRLNMTVCCRSNDLLWGCYGANVVHFSVLQELLAQELGAEIGTYYQVSNNLHAYTDLPMIQDFLNMPADNDGALYPPPFPLLQKGECMDEFLTDCERLVAGLGASPRTRFFADVALPLHDHYMRRKLGYTEPIKAAPCDWTTAYINWISRRTNGRE
jgi:hypothetical protein